MDHSALGKTGIQVSRLGLGTVELGLDYGLNQPGSFGKPAEEQSINLLNRAADSGINLFDTAPSYGCSEEILGKAFTDKKECIIATKVNIPSESIDAEKCITSSLIESRKKLQRKYLDIVQVHNATSDTFSNSDVFEVLVKEKNKGTIRSIGASVYDPENALVALDSGMVDVLQIAYNLLDQRMNDEVFDKAGSLGIGILCRSVYLKGVLTERAKWLPEHCAPLRKAVDNLKERMNLNSWDELSVFALRFALSNPLINSVLVGVRSEKELDFALNAFEKGQLSDEELELAYGCRMEEKFWLNPSNWGID